MKPGPAPDIAIFAEEIIISISAGVSPNAFVSKKIHPGLKVYASAISCCFCLNVGIANFYAPFEVAISKHPPIDVTQVTRLT